MNNKDNTNDDYYKKYIKYKTKYLEELEQFEGGRRKRRRSRRKHKSIIKPTRETQAILEHRNKLIKEQEQNPSNFKEDGDNKKQTLIDNLNKMRSSLNVLTEFLKNIEKSFLNFLNADNLIESEVKNKLRKIADDYNRVYINKITEVEMKLFKEINKLNFKEKNDKEYRANFNKKVHDLDNVRKLLEQISNALRARFIKLLDFGSVDGIRNIESGSIDEKFEEFEKFLEEHEKTLNEISFDLEHCKHWLGISLLPSYDCKSNLDKYSKFEN